MSTLVLEDSTDAEIKTDGELERLSPVGELVVSPPDVSPIQMSLEIPKFQICITPGSQGFHPDTPILNCTGGVTLARDLKVGDWIIGDNSVPQQILRVQIGWNHMYVVTPARGKQIRCTEHCILPMCGVKPHVGVLSKGISRYQVKFSANGHYSSKCFKTLESAEAYVATLSEDFFEISLSTYVCQNRQFKRETFVHHAPINFLSQPIPFDPYMIGYWLGDGTSSCAEITTIDPEVVAYFQANVAQYGLEFVRHSKREGESIHYNIVGAGENYSKLGANHFLNCLKYLNLLNNKHIPLVYIMNSREVRLQLLAGLVDSDGTNGGNCLGIVQKSTQLTDGIEYLCFSLGLMVSRSVCETYCIYKGERRYGIYNRLCITGAGLEDIPVLLDRKRFRNRVKNTSAVRHSISSVEYLAPEYCVGFTLSGNGRFLLGDFKVAQAHTVS